MSIFIREYDRKEGETTFSLSSNGRLVGRLEAKLSRDDWEQIHSLFDKAFQSGFADGCASKASEIRNALGISNDDK